jgi:site-specific DNA-cytosine methylase
MTLNPAPSDLPQRSPVSVTEYPATLAISAAALASADRLATLSPPFPIAGGRLPSLAEVRTLALSTTDLFSGAGTASLGAVWAGAVPVAGYNHWPEAVGTYHRHHGCGTLVDLQDSSAWAHPATRLLIASPDFSGHQRAAGSRQRFAQLREPSRRDAWYAARSRATSRRVAEFAEAHGYLARGDDGYQAILLEQLLEFGDWPYLGSYLNDFAVSGYAPTFYCVDAAHTGHPAHRERVIILFTRADRPLPDPVLRVDAVCRRHGTVRAAQQWTGSRRYWIGSYGRDYHWACPTCDIACQPNTGRAADAIGLTRAAPTMRQRANGEARRITDETIARITAGIEQHGPVPMWVQTTRTHRPARPISSPLPTLTTQQELGVWIPDPGGDFTASTFRYLDVDELALAAGLPAGYQITGARIRDRVRQIGHGNSPSLIAEFVARAAVTLL